MSPSKLLSKDFRIKISSKKEMATKSQCFELPISTAGNIIRKCNINGTAEVKARSGRPRKKKCSEEPTHQCKRAAKKSSKTGLAVHRTTIQCTLNNKNLHGRVARKHNLNCLKYAKENIEKPEAFWDNVLWTDKTKM